MGPSSQRTGRACRQRNLVFVQGAGTLSVDAEGGDDAPRTDVHIDTSRGYGGETDEA